MRFGIVIVALVLLAAGAWWMYSDREGRLEESGGAGQAPPTGASGAAAPPRRSLPDSTLGVLMGMEQAELYTLDPAPDAAQGRSAEECFHGRFVLEQVAVKRGQDGFKDVRDAVFQGLGGSDGHAEEPLGPTHGVRATWAGQKLDATFDFRQGFYVVHAWRGGEDVIGTLPTALKPVFDAAWKKHGLTKHTRDSAEKK